MTKLRMSWPNRITLTRILLIAPYVIAILHMNDPAFRPFARYVALAIFVVMAVSDALDGYLARQLNAETAIGRFLDPLADKLLIITTVILLAAESTGVPGMLLPDIVVVIIIAKDLYTVIGFIVIYLITSKLLIEPARVGKISTTLQLSMVVAILISPDVMKLLPAFRYIVAALWGATAAAAVLTTIAYTRDGARFVNAWEQQQKQDKTPPQP